MEEIKDPVTDQILVNYLEDMRRRLKNFHENKKSDVNAAYLYEEWKWILGSLDYLMQNASNQVMRFIVRESFQSMASSVAHEVRRENEIDARYAMEKFTTVVENLLEDVEKNKKWGTSDPVEMRLIPQAPAFLCGKCELDKERDQRLGVTIASNRG